MDRSKSESIVRERICVYFPHQRGTFGPKERCRHNREPDATIAITLQASSFKFQVPDFVDSHSVGLHMPRYFALKASLSAMNLLIT